MRKKLGHIIAGSLVEGFELRIAPETDLESIKTGKFVSIVSKHNTFFFFSDRYDAQGHAS